ncbi:MAG: type II toxin-antitoxin system VapC family toxin [Actinomycetota bacterium]|nr:type II toxin-antitoxin system VapC family toxin [Actinomycetota bacterium]MDI6821510.1 type II toxin-antitoxin system VapC family toxin [Actinomycetota bacterium]
MVETAYFIDTNIVMYARGKDHPYKEPCAKLILKIADGSFEKEFGLPVTDSEVFQEIIYRYALVGEWTTALQVCKDIYALGLEVLPVGLSEVSKLIELVEKYMKARIAPRDLIHAAVMLSNGIECIISTDAHFDLIKEVRRLDPAKL